MHVRGWCIVCRDVGGLCTLAGADLAPVRSVYGPAGYTWAGFLQPLCDSSPPPVLQTFRPAGRLFHYASRIFFENHVLVSSLLLAALATCLVFRR